MKRVMKFLLVVAVVFGWSIQIYAWSGKTHSALTEKAISDNNQSILDEYLKSQLGIDQGLNCVLLLDGPITPDSDRVLPEIPANPSVLDLLKAGSRLEDIPLPRARHHFHDPYRNTGLENKSEHPARAPVINRFSRIIWGLSFDLTGASCLKRASGTEGAEWEQEYESYFAWPDTRDYFYKSLTQESEAAREHYLALTFLSLGHVLHLSEDMGVPAHARNDFIEAHFRVPTGMWDNPLESHVEDEVGSSGIPARWLDGWTPQAKVLSKLADYWDIGDYTGQYVGTSPLSDWGLSERTNYQFLSKSTIFRENDGTKYYFPHPDVNNVTGYIKPGVYFWNSIPVHYKYISGYDITHLARTKYIKKYAYLMGIPYPIVTVAYHTTFDEAIYEDYAKVTIPRTIDYATGLINYFFRGIIEVSIGCPQGCDPETESATYSMTITNTSENTDREQVLKGGAFEFYWEDLSGNRTVANDFTVYTYDEADPNTTQLWDQDSILPYGEHIRATATFDVPSCTDIKDYVVVYKGAINDFEHPDDTDSDDTQALACWTKSESNSVPAASYTLLVTEWGGTDEYSDCAEYLKHIFDEENPDGYTLAKTPDSSCFDCRWRCQDYHTCPYGSPYCPYSCNITQIMIARSSSPDEFCVIIIPFPVAYCGFGPSCNGSYKRCFSREPGESYDDFWERIFNGGVFGDDSEIDCTEDGCKIPAQGTWTDSWIRVIWIPNP